MSRKFELLLAEDNMDEVILFEEALQGSGVENINFNYVNDGVSALKYLRQLPPYENQNKPDILILDLNMPKKNGHEVLLEVKTDEKLKALPVIILTTSLNRDDVMKSYENYANCFISKPTDFHAFEDIIHNIEKYWLQIARLPSSDD